MSGGGWHVILHEGRYEVFWVSADGEPPARQETYLDGDYLHQFDAQALADDANLLIADDPTGERAAALRRIVEALR
jgi:hypothetical protein